MTLDEAAAIYAKGENFKIDEFTGPGISQNSFKAGANWQKESMQPLIDSHAELLEFAKEMAVRYPNSPWIYEQANKCVNNALKLTENAKD